VSAPYWSDGQISLFLGDCREVTEWLAGDVLVTDPPYGRGWKQGRTRNDGRHADDKHPGIAGDKDTTTRDAALAMWGGVAVVFGDLMLPVPANTKQVLGYRKAADAGNKGTFGGFRRDLEAIYLIGPWPAGLNGRTSVLVSGTPLQAGSTGLTARYGHPHAKPVDVMETLIAACPPGVIADPFAGSGSTLVAARNQGRAAIGVELEERYCETIARRLSQADLFSGVAS
jgi:DNA methylase